MVVEFDRRPATDRRPGPWPARARLVRDRSDGFRRARGGPVHPRHRRRRAGQGVAADLGGSSRSRGAGLRCARGRRRPGRVPGRSARGRACCSCRWRSVCRSRRPRCWRRSTSTSAAAGSAGANRSVWLAMIAVVIGIVPGVAAIGDGGWKTPTTTLGRLMNAWLVDDPADGDYRVLLIGDSRVLPGPVDRVPRRHLVGADRRRRPRCPRPLGPTRHRGDRVHQHCARRDRIVVHPARAAACSLRSASSTSSSRSSTA